MSISISLPVLSADGFLFAWTPSFTEGWEGKFSEAQRYIDTEVIERMAPYTPILTGAMYKSPWTHSIIGSGKIVYGVPYDKKQYYTLWYRHSTDIHPFAGAYWFERMKADNVDEIAAGVERITGGRMT